MADELDAELLPAVIDYLETRERMFRQQSRAGEGDTCHTARSREVAQLQRISAA